MYYPEASIQALSFGLFNSDGFDIPRAYKISREGLYLEEPSAFFSKRFSEEGYQVAGNKQDLSDELRVKLLFILKCIPSNLLLMNLPAINSPGNKLERTYFFDIAFTQRRSVSFEINEYDPTHLQLPKEALELKDRIHSLLPELEQVFPLRFQY